MNSIRQITNFDISIVYKTIQKGGDSSEIVVDFPYITQALSASY